MHQRDKRAKRFNASREAKWRAACLIRYALLSGFPSLDERYGNKANAVRRELSKLAEMLEKKALKEKLGYGPLPPNQLDAVK